MAKRPKKQFVTLEKMSNKEKTRNSISRSGVYDDT